MPQKAPASISFRAKHTCQTESSRRWNRAHSLRFELLPKLQGCDLLPSDGDGYTHYVHARALDGVRNRKQFDWPSRTNQAPQAESLRVQLISFIGVWQRSKLTQAHPTIRDLLCAERRKWGRVMRPPRIQLRMNTRRSALITSAFVVIIPCGKPG